MTGWSSSAKNPIEIQRTPWASGGMSMSSMTVGAWDTPSIRGMEKPQTSASTTATSRPRPARATARLVVTDDLPTPPLPDAMSSTRVDELASANGTDRPSECPKVGLVPAVADGSPCSRSRSSSRSVSLMTVKSTPTASTPSRATTASSTDRWISAFRGQPGTVRATCTLTRRPSIATPRTMPRSTMLRLSSGSWTGRRASMTWDSVTGTDTPPVPRTGSATGLPTSSIRPGTSHDATGGPGRATGESGSVE